MSSSRPPGVDAAAWRALEAAVRTQPSLPPCAALRVKNRLHEAVEVLSAPEASPCSLLLAVDRYNLPWRDGNGAWRSLPSASNAEPSCVPSISKRFVAVSSLQAWLDYEARLPAPSRLFYEVLREGTPCRYWLDLDCPASAALMEVTVDALALLLERCIALAMANVLTVDADALSVVTINGNGASQQEKGRISLHLIATGALLPNNEHAGAAVRLAVIDNLRRAAEQGDPVACALVCCGLPLQRVVDPVNTKNRLRRLTGHTKIGQNRHSAPLPRHAHLPRSALFVSARVHDEQVLEWRLQPAMLHAAQRRPLGSLCANHSAIPCDVEAEAAIRAELRCISELKGSQVVSIKPPSGSLYPCWMAFTDCSRCPWREQDTPILGCAPGDTHRSSRLFVTLRADRLEVGCTAARHVQRLRRSHAFPHTRQILYGEPTPSLAEASSPDAVRFVDAHMLDIFSPSFAAQQ